LSNIGGLKPGLKLTGSEQTKFWRIVWIFWTKKSQNLFARDLWSDAYGKTVSELLAKSKFRP
jgi:hypothetical protein